MESDVILEDSMCLSRKTVYLTVLVLLYGHANATDLLTAQYPAALVILLSLCSVYSSLHRSFLHGICIVYACGCTVVLTQVATSTHSEKENRKCIYLLVIVISMHGMTCSASFQNLYRQTAQLNRGFYHPP